MLERERGSAKDKCGPFLASLNARDQRVRSSVRPHPFRPSYFAVVFLLNFS